MLLASSAGRGIRILGFIVPLVEDLPSGRCASLYVSPKVSSTGNGLRVFSRKGPLKLTVPRLLSRPGRFDPASSARPSLCRAPNAFLGFRRPARVERMRGRTIKLAPFRGDLPRRVPELHPYLFWKNRSSLLTVADCAVASCGVELASLVFSSSTPHVKSSP